jgi:broad specificity phosphatase PhoE
MAGRIVVVRHGETEWSLAGKHTSRTDLPLTEAGRARASHLPAFFSGRAFSVVMSSPLRRARETCELAGFGDRAVINEDLREWDYGEYEGLTTPEIRESNPSWNLWRDGCPGGETPSEVGARADRALAALRDAVAAAGGGGGSGGGGSGGDGSGGDGSGGGDSGGGDSGGSGDGDGDAIAFAHGHILRVLGARWISMDPWFGSRIALSAGAVCEFGFERETEVFTLWNGGPR